MVLHNRDTISSHDKKRNYLECLENYVKYLEAQMKLVGLQSYPMSNVVNYGSGMNNRSLRVSSPLCHGI